MLPIKFVEQCAETRPFSPLYGLSTATCHNFLQHGGVHYAATAYANRVELPFANHHQPFGIGIGTGIGMLHLAGVTAHTSRKAQGLPHRRIKA